MKQVIDLNADLGEGGQFDRQLLSLVSSANISCGAHAGTEQDISQAIDWAIEHGVAIGAHPSYPDRENWGRVSLRKEPDELRRSLREQLQWIKALVNQKGGQLRHVKPHGALYNDAAKDIKLAELIAECVRDFDPSLALVALAGSRLVEAGQGAGLEVISEAFVDRRYQADGTLVARTHERAMITDPAEALAQATCFVNGDLITAVDGSQIRVQADSLCIHGDSAHALTFAQRLYSEFLLQGIVVKSPE
jgi:5-oxoprolinase (ATP-hydrolysing) subunit A